MTPLSQIILFSGLVGFSMVFGLFWHWVWLSGGDGRGAKWIAGRLTFDDNVSERMLMALGIGLKFLTAGIGLLIAVIVYRLLAALLCG